MNIKNKLIQINLKKSTLTILFTMLGALMVGWQGAIIGFVIGMVLDDNFN